VVILYNWRETWRLQAEIVPASEKDPDGWCASDKFTVVRRDISAREDLAIEADLVSGACLKKRISKRRKQPLILRADKATPCVPPFWKGDWKSSAH
jgi:hypothetical protein